MVKHSTRKTVVTVASLCWYLSIGCSGLLLVLPHESVLCQLAGYVNGVTAGMVLGIGWTYAQVTGHWPSPGEIFGWRP